MKTMKVDEAIKYLANKKNPDIEQIRANCLNLSADTMKNRKKIHKMRYVLTAAFLIITISMLSAFGVIPFIPQWSSIVGEVIESLTFDAFNVNKFDSIIIEDHDNVHSEYYFNVTDPKVPSGGIYLGEYFTTFEEAEEHLNFKLKGLNYLAGFSFREIFVSTDNYCSIFYENKSDDGLTEESFLLSQQYVGKNAQIYVNTTATIEKIIINGDTEALLQTTITNGYPHMYMLMWIKDNIGYTLSASDREELIKMAESVG